MQKLTTTHDLIHRVLPLPHGGSFTLSYRDDYVPDLPALYAKLLAQLDQAGDGIQPESIIGDWKNGGVTIQMTYADGSTRSTTANATPGGRS